MSERIHALVAQARYTRANVVKDHGTRHDWEYVVWTEQND